MEDSVGLPVVNGLLMVQLGNSKDTLKNGLLRSLNGRLTGVHKGVVQRCRDRVQRTTRFLSGT